MTSYYIKKDIRIHTWWCSSNFSCWYCQKECIRYL